MTVYASLKPHSKQPTSLSLFLNCIIFFFFFLVAVCGGLEWDLSFHTRDQQSKHCVKTTRPPENSLLNCTNFNFIYI